MSFKITASTIISLSFFSAVAFAQKQDEVSLALDWTPNTNHTGIYVANARKFFEKEGLKVKIIQPTKTTSTQLAASGGADFAVSFMPDVYLARDQGLKVVSIAAIIQDNTSCFAWRSSANIKTIKDFEGKRYGGWGTPEETATLRYLMKKNGADFSKLKVVTTGVSDFLPTTEKNADIMWIFSAWDGIRAEIAGVKFSTLCLKDLDPALNTHSPVIITSEKTLKSKAEIVKKFLKATAEGYDIAIHDPAGAAKDLLSQVPELDSKLVNKSALYLAPLYSKGTKNWGIQKTGTWKAYGDWYKGEALLPKVSPPEEYFTNTFLPQK